MVTPINREAFHLNVQVQLFFHDVKDFAEGFVVLIKFLYFSLDEPAAESALLLLSALLFWLLLSALLLLFERRQQACLSPAPCVNYTRASWAKARRNKRNLT